MFVPSDFALRFDEASRILILEHEFPDIGSVNWVKLVSLKSGLTVKPENQKETKESANLLYPTLCLRLTCELARLDLDNSVEIDELFTSSQVILFEFVRGHFISL